MGAPPRIASGKAGSPTPNSISTVRFRALREAHLVVPYRRPGVSAPGELPSLDALVLAKVDGHRTREDLSVLLMISDLEVARVLESLESRGLVVVDRGGPDPEGVFGGASLADGEIDDALLGLPDDEDL